MRKQKVYLETTMFNYYFDGTKNAQPPTDIEDRVDAIRDKIYEKTRNMTPSERTAYYNVLAEKARDNGFYVVKSAVKDTAEVVGNG